MGYMYFTNIIPRVARPLEKLQESAWRYRDFLKIKNNYFFLLAGEEFKKKRYLLLLQYGLNKTYFLLTVSTQYMRNVFTLSNPLALVRFNSYLSFAENFCQKCHEKKKQQKTKKKKQKQKQKNTPENRKKTSTFMPEHIKSRNAKTCYND